MEKYQTSETVLRDEQGTTRTVQSNATVNQPAYSTNTYTTTPGTSTYTSGTSTYPLGTTSSSQPTTDGTSFKAKWNRFINKMQAQYNRRFGSAAGDSYRSDPLGGYTRKGPGYYEKKHKFTRRITKRGNPPPMGTTSTSTTPYGSTYPTTTTTPVYTGATPIYNTGTGGYATNYNTGPIYTPSTTVAWDPGDRLM